MSSDYTALSREISYALRHAPQEYGLTLDAQGWVPTEDLLNALKRQQKYADVTAQDIADMIAASEKKRHEIDGGRIRALYGHGTARKFLRSIVAQGLIPKDR